MRRYLFFVLIALDQLANTLAGGYPDETISARLWRNRHKHPFVDTLSQIVDLVFELLTGDAQHCKNAHQRELINQDLPTAYR